jgi:hypothetical protein
MLQRWYSSQIDDLGPLKLKLYTAMTATETSWTIPRVPRYVPSDVPARPYRIDFPLAVTRRPIGWVKGLGYSDIARAFYGLKDPSAVLRSELPAFADLELVLLNNSEDVLETDDVNFGGCLSLEDIGPIMKKDIRSLWFALKRFNAESNSSWEAASDTVMVAETPSSKRIAMAFGVLTPPNTPCTQSATMSKTRARSERCTQARAGVESLVISQLKEIRGKSMDLSATKPTIPEWASVPTTGDGARQSEPWVRARNIIMKGIAFPSGTGCSLCRERKEDCIVAGGYAACARCTSRKKSSRVCKWQEVEMQGTQFATTETDEDMGKPGSIDRESGETVASSQATCELSQGSSRRNRPVARNVRDFMAAPTSEPLECSPSISSQPRSTINRSTRECVADYDGTAVDKNTHGLKRKRF